METAYQNGSQNLKAIFNVSEVLTVFQLYQTAVEYIAPIFELEKHGQSTAINLALSYLKFENKAEGLAIIDELRQINIPNLEGQIASIERRLRALEK